jgi:hypothetical protein
MTHTLYDTDVHAWTRQQTKALQENDWAALDQDHVIETVIIEPNSGAPP